MPSPKAPVTQSELTRYTKALRAVEYDDLRVQIEKPDGTRVAIIAGKAGEAVADGDDIVRMIHGVSDP